MEDDDLRIEFFPEIVSIEDIFGNFVYLFPPKLTFIFDIGPEVFVEFVS